MNSEKVSSFFDGHNDTLALYFLSERPVSDFFEHNSSGHIDFPRAQTGGFMGGLFAVFIPHSSTLDEKGLLLKNTSKALPVERPEPIEQDHAKMIADRALACLRQLETSSAGLLEFVSNSKALKRCLKDGVMAAVLHFEGAEAIEKEVGNLKKYYDQGLRSLGLVWSRDNCFGHGVSFNFPGSPDQGPGLTEAGKKLVRACNELGIVVDLSHLNEAGFWDVAATSSAPLVASHSNAHALCASPRNLTDKQLDAIGKSGGIVGINFCVMFLREDGQPNRQTSLDVMVDHLYYIAQRIGYEHVGFGSDFDGASIPDDIGDVSGMPRLLLKMAERGFSGTEIEAISYGNWVRVLEKSWDSTA